VLRAGGGARAATCLIWGRAREAVAGDVGSPSCGAHVAQRPL
jgi:hypothetical protein